MRARSRLGLLCLPLLTTPVLAQSVASPEQLDKVSVSASRGGGVTGETPQRITVITREELEQALALTSDVSQVLSSLLPSFAPPRQKLSNAGETFRGRSPLFMIDGVPQSNPLRDGAREGHTIDLAMVERIEVIHGASAEHGLGATGGIINFVTRRPDITRIRQHAGVRVTTPTDHESDGLGHRLDYRIDGAREQWDFLLAAAVEQQGIYYDADGRRIGMDNAQGDIMDSRSHDVMFKAGYWFDEDRNLSLTVNRYRLKGRNDYVLVEGDRTQGRPATSRRGRPLGEAPYNDVWTASLDYHHARWHGNELRAQVYHQRFRALYGGSTSSTFQDPAISPGQIFDQSENQSDKSGAKLTVSRDGLFDQRLKLTAGLDLLQDETSQVLARTDRTWVPETRFQNIAPFLQGEFRATDALALYSGLRYEHARLDVDDFSTLAAYNGVQVKGGRPSFSETLFNLGLTWQMTDSVQLFASYAEGFGMPDVGRVLRGIDVPGQSVDDFLALRPIVTDNREIGWRIQRPAWGAEVSYFRSDSDYGSRLVERGGTYDVSREKVEIEGVELDAHYMAAEGHRLGLGYAHVNARYDADGDGRTDTRMDGRNVPPDQLSVRWQAQWTERTRSHLSVSHYFSRNFPGLGAANDFESYQMVDLSLLHRLPVGQISVGIANLFNEDYITFFAQTATQQDGQYVSGRGRTLSLGYSLDF